MEEKFLGLFSSQELSQPITQTISPFLTSEQKKNSLARRTIILFEIEENQQFQNPISEIMQLLNIAENHMIIRT
jgi:hypothetical protein